MLKFEQFCTLILWEFVSIWIFQLCKTSIKSDIPKCLKIIVVMLEHMGSKQLFRLEFLKTYDNICKITTEKNKWHRRKTIRIPDGRAAGLAYQLLPLKAQILIQMLVGCVKLYLILTKKKLISSFLDGRNDFTYT